MYYFKLILVLSFLSKVAYTQEKFNLSVSEESKWEFFQEVDFIGADAESFFVIKSYYILNDFHQVIYKINATTLKITHELNVDEAFPVSNITGKVINGKIFLIREQGEEKGRQKTYYRHLLSTRDLTPLSKEVFLFTARFKSVNEIYEIEIKTSNSEQVTAVGIQDLSSGKKQDHMKYFVFDEEGSLAYQDSVLLKVWEGKSLGFGPIQKSDYLGIKGVSDVGDLLVGHYDGKETSCYLFNDQNRGVKRTRVEKEGYLIKDFGSSFQSTGKINLSGFYLSEKKHKTAGLFSKSMTDEGLIVAEKHFVLNPNLTRAKGNKMAYDGSEYKSTIFGIRELKTFEDGSYLLFVKSGGGFMIKFSAEGELNWISYVPMRFFYEENRGGPASYGIHYSDESIYLFHNAHENSFGPDDRYGDEVVAVRCPGYNHILMGVKLDIETGDWEYQMIAKQKDMKLFAMPRYSCSNTEKSEFYFYYGNYKKAKLAKISIQ